MSLQDGMLLYHGSYAVIDKIELNKCAPGKDFGRGFYVTEDFEQAKGFIRNSLKKAKNIGVIPQDRRYGYVTVFRYHSQDDIPCYNFETTDKNWLWFVSMNRRSQLAGKFRKLSGNPRQFNYRDESVRFCAYLHTFKNKNMFEETLTI
nr:DUF3990 domain-containing protein [uncultured Anaerobutyricum sp.]